MVVSSRRRQYVQATAVEVPACSRSLEWEVVARWRTFPQGEALMENVARKLTIADARAQSVLCAVYCSATVRCGAVRP
jgi:hypothetical protein